MYFLDKKLDSEFAFCRAFLWLTIILIFQKGNRNYPEKKWNLRRENEKGDENFFSFEFAWVFCV